MASRDARYRQEAGIAQRRVEMYRKAAVDAVAALIVQTGDRGWLDLMPCAGKQGDADGEQVARRVAELQSTLANRSR